jgi:L-fucose isomerase-like protein
MARTTFGCIVGNRDVFPIELAIRGRAQVMERLAGIGIDAVAVGERETEGGVISSRRDALRCAELLRANAGRIDGILVTLPNFGDERAVADAIRLSGLQVPVYVHAFPDRSGALSLQERRDSFCGKLSICSVLTQYGIPSSAGSRHVLAPESPDFEAEMRWFADVCRVVRGLRRARVACVGERTTPFKTVRYSEKLLEAAGINVETVSLAHVAAAVSRLGDADARVKAKADELTRYLDGAGEVPREAVTRSAKLGVVLEEELREEGIDAFAIQCWPALQEAAGLFPCAAMSLMGNALVPAACEADVMGAVAMYALQLAGGTPAALMDWNNNLDDDPDRCILFHCSNTPRALLGRCAAGLNRMALKGNPRESCYCTLDGALAAGPFGFSRLMTDDARGRIVGYVGDGEITADRPETFGTTGVARIGGLPRLLSFMTRHGFEHHVAVSGSPRTSALHEAFTRYLGWRIYRHGAGEGAPAEAW